MPHESVSISGSEEGAPTRTPRAFWLVGSITSSTWHAAGRGWGRWIHRAQAPLSTCATMGPRALDPEDGLVVPLPESRCAHTDSPTQISKIFEVSRRSRDTTRPTTPRGDPDRAGRARTRSGCPCPNPLVRCVLSHLFGRDFWDEREQNRGKRARARRLTFTDPARDVGGSSRTGFAGRARRRRSPVSREKRRRVLGDEAARGRRRRHGWEGPRPRRARRTRASPPLVGPRSRAALKSAQRSAGGLRLGCGSGRRGRGDRHCAVYLRMREERVADRFDASYLRD